MGGTSEPAAANGLHHQHRAGALIKQLLHRHLVCKESLLLPSVAERASHLLQVCLLDINFSYFLR